MKWRPIETAPKDGTAVLIFDVPHGLIYSARFFDGEWISMSCIDGYFGCRENEASHWMPLPEAPNKDDTE